MRKKGRLDDPVIGQKWALSTFLYQVLLTNIVISSLVLLGFGSVFFHLQFFRISCYS